MFAKLRGGPKDVTVQKNVESLRKQCSQTGQAKTDSTTGDKRGEMDSTCFKCGRKDHIDRNCFRKAQQSASSATERGFSGAHQRRFQSGRGMYVPTGEMKIVSMSSLGLIVVAVL